MKIKNFFYNGRKAKISKEALADDVISSMLPTATTEDAGKAVVVGEDGKYELGEASGSSGTHIYGAKWDGVHAQMTRYGDSMKFPIGVSNFNTANGTINSSYNNPFDNLYPWSGRKLCNISVETYMGLQTGASIKDCVTHWEDEAGFSYDDPDGVWVYTPEFWGRSFDSNGSRCYEVADKEVEGFIHYAEQITSRWRGSSEEREINGETKTILLSKKGAVPCGDVPLSEIHQYAKNAGMTLDTIYNLDGSLLLYLVEYANQNAQYAIGMGCVNLFKSLTTAAATTDSNIVKFASTEKDNVPVGSIFAVQSGSFPSFVTTYYTVTNVKVDENDENTLNVTLDKNITISNGAKIELRFMSNRSDEEIGSGSGFVGVSEKTLAYYRGESLWGNQFYYVLGIYNHEGQAYVSTSDDESDNYDAYDAEHHVATGIQYAQDGGPIKALGFAEGFSISLGATETGEPADYENPVGDDFFAGVDGDYILRVGGVSNGGRGDPARYGPWYWRLGGVADNSNWDIGGRPRLKHP